MASRRLVSSLLRSASRLRAASPPRCPSPAGHLFNRAAAYASPLRLPSPAGHLFNSVAAYASPAAAQHFPPSGSKTAADVRQDTQVNIHNTNIGATMSKTAGGEKSSNFGLPLPLAASRILKEHKQSSVTKKRDFVHVLLKKNKTFVTVTDARGNKKTGASAGCLEERKGRSRLSRYAAEATAEHVGRSARKMGLRSVVMKVKGATFFKKKKKVILSFREGFRGERVRDQSPIMFIHDVTQLPHNGCRLPKQRRV
ncbi:small ribosomal subunit protein uS11m [Phragmites australis]|uniref:small ribosomal subunit protein uS11m n=1 Tax=Phragmites australis TaxID=29695 RepID=UPI002D771DD8|nr:small ribosomal subunit protein uS11m [Phragmites australis]